MQPDNTVELAIAEGNGILNKENPVVANNLTPLSWNWEDVRTRETEICRAYADSLLEYVQSKEDGIQIAFITPGSLHGSILENLRQFTVPNEVLYNSEIKVKKLTGKAIKNVIEASLEVLTQNLKDNAKKSTTWDKHSGDITYLSKGMEVSYDLTKEKGSRIQSVKYNGSDLNDETTYIVALSEFQCNLKDLYPGLNETETINTFEEGVTAAFDMYLRENKYADSIKMARYMPVNDTNSDGIQDIVLKDDATGVIVEAPYGVLTENSVLSVSKKGATNESTKNIDEIFNSFKRGDFYDVKIYDKNDMNKPITSFSPSFVTVKYPLPDGWQENTTEVIRVEKTDDVGFEETFETIDGKKYVVIKTDHFSDYLLLSKDPIDYQMIMTIVAALLAIFAIWAMWYITVLRKKINYNN